MAEYRVEFVVAALRLDDLDQLDLVELVHADHAARADPGRAGLGAETRAVGAVIFRQFAGLEQLFAVDVGDRRLGGGDEVKFAAALLVESLLHHVGLVLELGELADADHAVVADHEGRRHLGVAVLVHVQVKQVLDQRPLEPCAPAAVKQEAAAGELGAAREVHQPEAFAKLGVRLRFEIEVRLLAPMAKFHVVLLAGTGRDAGVREVGQAQQNVAQLGVGLGGLAVQRGNLVADVAHLGFFGLGLVGFFLAHERANFLRGGVAPGLEILDGGDGFTALGVKPHDVVHLGGKFLPARGEPFADVVGVVPKQSDIQHGRQYRAVCGGRKALTRPVSGGHNRGSLPSIETR